MHVVGVVKNGAIELPPGVELPEGTEVTVRVVSLPAAIPEEPSTSEPQPTFHEGLMKFAGIVKDTPPDYSINHDHYLYGMPKSSP